MTDKPNDGNAVDEGSELALLDQFDPAVEPGSAAEAAAQAPYRRLLARLRDLGALAPPEGWEARVESRLRAAHAAERRRRMGVGVAVTAAVVAIAMVSLLRGRPAPLPRPLQVTVVASDGEPRRGAAALGDRLRATASRRTGHVELRVYLGTRLVGRCPAADSQATCRRSPALQLELELREPGLYRVFALESAQPLAPPGTGGLDLDLVHARQAAARIEKWEPIRIR